MSEKSKVNDFMMQNLFTGHNSRAEGEIETIFHKLEVLNPAIIHCMKFKRLKRHRFMVYTTVRGMFSLSGA